MSPSVKVALIGAGPMAQAYGHVLKADGVDSIVVGRGETSAAKFKDVVGLPVLTGGLDANHDALKDCTHAIVALPVPVLAEASITLMDAGVRNMLVEKPAGLNAQEIASVVAKAEITNSDVFVAYNRRFYASVQEARRRIAEDGGATSFRFEISEWSDRIGPSAQPDSVKASWFLANSTHVADMAFFMGGFPDMIETMSAGTTGWHDPAVFVGHGLAKTGALFSYHADWNAAPRWMVEICTNGRTYMFQPLEGLKIRTKAGFAVEEIECEGASDDTDFKPGIRRQVAAFLSPDGSPHLLRVADQLDHQNRIYDVMVGGS
ncbi:Gfo/Idh/MocA family oxidoreductase [uncultured Algimonas sp.]|uniref:Gfo/Idh/MocA family protein n=1 Tax=uncultured Algimonas sp. TaxID=1547920 RepID=UPI002602A182|nr:Gfo/Idh/MocA family oxidoreductase [uncultured Algimonas sp.]